MTIVPGSKDRTKRRILAAAGDGIAAGALFGAAWALGRSLRPASHLAAAFLYGLAAAFVLLRDRAALAKRRAGLRIEGRGTIRRNLTLAVLPAALAAAECFAFWFGARATAIAPVEAAALSFGLVVSVLLSLAGGLLALVEIALVLFGRDRLGDRWAGTKVLMEKQRETA